MKQQKIYSPQVREKSGGLWRSTSTSAKLVGSLCREVYCRHRPLRMYGIEVPHLHPLPNLMEGQLTLDVRWI
jgi:hypothetical protein